MNIETKKSAFSQKQIERKQIVEKLPEQLGTLALDQAEVKSYRFILDNVSKGFITNDSILSSFINPSFDSAGDLINRFQGGCIQINNQYVKSKDIGTTGIAKKKTKLKSLKK